MLFEEFTPVAPISQASLDAFGDTVPPPIKQFWQEHGTGLIGDGYFRLVDPTRAAAMLGDASPVFAPTPIIFATAMADLIAWWPDEKQWLVAKTRLGKLQTAPVAVEKLALVMKDEAEFRDVVWDWAPYPDAAARLGAPDFDECLMHVPMLGLGGRGDAATMARGSLWVHVGMMVTMTGRPKDYSVIPWPNWIDPN